MAAPTATPQSLFSVRTLQSDVATLSHGRTSHGDTTSKALTPLPAYHCQVPQYGIALHAAQQASGVGVISLPESTGVAVLQLPLAVTLNSDGHTAGGGGGDGGGDGGAGKSTPLTAPFAFVGFVLSDDRVHSLLLLEALPV